METPHVKHHGLGNKWLDLSIALIALFVSFISILIAWHHSTVMQELVHQNERLVEAESLPYLQIDTSDLDTDLRTPAYRLTVQNQGVGPARVSQVVITVNGRPVPNFNTLIDRCCAPGLLQAASRGSKQFRGIRNGEVILSTLHDRMIRPGEAVDAFSWRTTPANQPIVDRLKQGFASNAINTSICYCSVFDDCWVRTDDDQRPVPVKECPMPKVPYNQ